MSANTRATKYRNRSPVLARARRLSAASFCALHGRNIGHSVRERDRVGDQSAESGGVVAVGPLVLVAGAGWGDGAGVWVGGAAETCSARQAAMVRAPRPYRLATNRCEAHAAEVQS